MVTIQLEGVVLEIDFAHFKFGLSAEDERLNSPHFNNKIKQDKLFASFNSKRKLEYEHKFHLDDTLILFANEAFPESAINDPLGDLHVWDLWQSGVRRFPYPGQYLPLEIFSQDAKIQSASTVGVVGECLTGAFASEGIAPWPIVRVIRHWPDFIFYDRLSSRFALVESKAFTNIGGAMSGLMDRFRSSTFRSFLVDALSHLISDRSVSVWGGFTRVVNVNPFRAQFTFVETYLEDGGASSRPTTMLNVLGEFVMQLALGQTLDDLNKYSLERKNTRGRNKENKAPPHFLSSAIEDALSQLPNSMISTLSSEDYHRIMQAAHQFFSLHEEKIFRSVESKGYDGSASKQTSTDKFEQIRIVGNTKIFGRRLNLNEAAKIDRVWERNWSNVGVLHREGSFDVCRCGGLQLMMQQV